jgi:mono/diheme cytochrome c family protein
MKIILGSLLALVVLAGFQNPPKKNAQQTSPPKTAKERGKLVYLQRCLVCHQADGGGVPHLNAPLDGATAVQGNDKAKLIRIVLGGMTDRVEIDGEYYSNNMPPNKDLTDQQVADVLSYVRSNWSNKASAVTPAEVKAVRPKIK